MAVDPGQHVGLAFRNDDGSYDAVMIHNDMEQVWDLVMAAKPAHIIIERFQTAGRISKPGLDTVEVQGSMYSLAHILGAKLYFHNPQHRTSMMRKAQQILGAGSSKIESHAVDALAHLLVWEMMHKELLHGN